MKALILVDLQNDFCPGGALAVPEGDQTVAIANTLMSKFDLVIATQDWHPENHGSFAANQPGSAVGDVIDLNGLQQVLWPVHCVQGSPGAAFHPDLNTAPIAEVFRKGIAPEVDSYSGFFDNGRCQATGLDDYLKSKGVADVYVCGLATDYCVKFTALDAVEFGYRTFLIEDACRAVNLSAGDEEKAIEEMEAASISIMQSTAI